LGEKSAVVQLRVEALCQLQWKRLLVGPEHASPKPITCSARMRPGDFRKYCQLDEAGNSLMCAAIQQMQLSVRAYHRVLKLARTLADLVREKQITTAHLAEALQYRPKFQLM